MKIEISKAKWYALGGLRNSDLWRRQTPDGVWHYYRGALA